MAVWTPTFKLWASDGLSTIYTFPAVIDTNIPGNVKHHIIQTNPRSGKGIVIPGGDKPWELFLDFAITADGYTAIATAIEALESAIPFHTAFLLRADTSISTYFNQSEGGYHVKRLQPIEYTGIKSDLRNDLQRVTIRFEANSW